MKLGDRFQKIQEQRQSAAAARTNPTPRTGQSARSNPGAPPAPVRPDQLSGSPDRRNNLKGRIHRRMIERLNLASLESLDSETLRFQIRQIIAGLISEESIPLSERERTQLEDEVLNETFGLGPIEPYLHDPDVSDILVNTHEQVYIERFGLLELTDTQFDDDDHLMRIIDRIVARVGRRVDESSPMVDARLPDGSRVNAIIPPLAVDGPILSIRRFGVKTLDVNDLLQLGSLTSGMIELFRGIIKARLNTIISGGTGSGKTTLLNAVSQFIPADERVVTIEDAAELQLLQPHVVRLETRPANIEGSGMISQRDLVRNALRMRPDRIIVGEVRGQEVLDMLQAMNTGHDGSLTTVHANSTRDALHRLETLMLLSGVNLPHRAMREQVASGLEVIIQVARMSDGTRKVQAVTEIVGMEGEVIALQDIFVFHRIGVGDDGRVAGQFRATGIRPRFADRLAVAGVPLPADIFAEGRVI
ncbi:MAG TPA: CpaF family protein [Dongiaceae bacterium]|jgi:pilus assembly protein CpaF|nr:CpaF family protein [Dongiaceae bacterium]